MKKYFLTLCIGLALFTSCEEDLVVFDNVNGASLATFQENSPATLVYNPAADTENVYTVSVSTVSTSDRAVSVSIDPASTIDPASYTASLNPVIPAGAYSADVVITTFASDIFPATGSVLTLNLDSVQGATVESFSVGSYDIPFTVECPTVDLAGITGEGANVIENEILTGGFGAPLSAGGLTRTVLAGPGENQVTIVGGVGFNGSEDMILDVNPTTGDISYGGPEGVVFFFNGPNPINYTDISGRALTCIGLIQIQIAAPFGSPFDQNSFRLQF